MWYRRGKKIKDSAQQFWVLPHGIDSQRSRFTQSCTRDGKYDMDTCNGLRARRTTITNSWSMIVRVGNLISERLVLQTKPNIDICSTLSSI